MPQIVPGMALQVSVWTADGVQAAVNVLHYQVLSIAGTPTDDTDVADSYMANVASTLYPPLMCNGATVAGVQCRILTGITPLPSPAAGITGAPVDGTGGDVGMSRQTCGLLSWYTGIAGRHGRGRTYLPFPPTALDQGLGTPTPDYITAATTLANAIAITRTVLNLATTGSAVMAFCLRNRITGALSVVNNYIVRNAWATQRRRGSYGRANDTPFN